MHNLPIWHARENLPMSVRQRIQSPQSALCVCRRLNLEFVTITLMQFPLIAGDGDSKDVCSGGEALHRQHSGDQDTVGVQHS